LKGSLSIRDESNVNACRRHQPRNGKKCLSHVVSARLQNLVYPAISETNNHCGNAKEIVPETRRKTARRAVLGVIPANAGTSTPRLAIDPTALEYGIAGLPRYDG